MNEVLKRNLTGLVVLLLFCSAHVSAYTVMIRYDIFVDSDISDSPRIRELSVGLESGIMQTFFDNGHIVFNTPGEIRSSDVNENTDTEIPQYIMEARKAGAQILLYYSLHYSGATKNDLYIDTVDYDFIHSDANFFNNDSVVLGSEPGSSALDASRIVVSQLIRNDYIRSILQ